MASHSWTLIREKELRMLTSPDSQFKLKLISGDAEIFGYELAPQHVYTIYPETNISIVSWNGCVLEGEGTYEHCYISEESQCLINLNLHACLQRKREDSKCKGEIGPRVLICGSKDVGKSTLCNILLNYSTRANFPLLFVDLDIGQGEIVPEGNLSAFLVDQPFKPDTEKSSHVPLSYFYGHNNIDVQPDLYKFYMSELASSIYSKMEKSLKVKAAGYIINTCGYVVKTGLEMIKNAIECFDVDLVIVIDDELLYTQIKEICQKRHIVVLPKSGGSKSISGDQRKKLRSKRVTEYFYGAQKELHPHTFSVSFDEIKIYKIGLPKVSEYCMPVGSEDSIQLEVILMEPNADMIHHLCAISCGENEKSILSSNIYGLVVITDIDVENKNLVLFSPGPAPLPNMNLIIGSIEYMDIH